jgi:hypothetical protein
MSGSMLCDYLAAERKRIHDAWRMKPATRSIKKEFPPLPKFNLRPPEERLAEADRLRSEIPWNEFRKIEDTIRESAEDCGELSSILESPPEIGRLGCLTVVDIQRMVAWRYGMSRADIIGPRRKARIVRPRQVAIYLSRLLTPYSLSQIGRRFGGRDHTTVLHSVRRIQDIINGTNTASTTSTQFKANPPDAALAEEIRMLTGMLLG